MNPQAALLKASIDADIQEIEKLYQQLEIYASPLDTKDSGLFLAQPVFRL